LTYLLFWFWNWWLAVVIFELSLWTLRSDKGLFNTCSLVWSDWGWHQISGAQVWSLKLRWRGHQRLEFFTFADWSFKLGALLLLNNTLEDPWPWLLCHCYKVGSLRLLRQKRL